MTSPAPRFYDGDDAETQCATLEGRFIYLSLSLSLSFRYADHVWTRSYYYKTECVCVPGDNNVKRYPVPAVFKLFTSARVPRTKFYNLLFPLPLDVFERQTTVAYRRRGILGLEPSPPAVEISTFKYVYNTRQIQSDKTLKMKMNTQ